MAIARRSMAVLGIALATHFSPIVEPSGPVPIAPAPLAGTPTGRVMDTGQDGPPARVGPIGYGEPSVELAPAPVESVSARVAIRGIATWYSAGRGLYAAAGPALRLGRWRGRIVTVCASEGNCISNIPLIDWCACGDRPMGPTIVDLSRDAFARLALPSRGLMEVTVTW